jgi:peptidoglycan/xylan/chitin deacetylase (PgdA/CDA1 family)
MYHAIGSAVPDDSQSRYSLSRQEFADQMHFLAENKIPVSRIEEQAERIGACVITFDDGYRDNLTVAAPILAKWGFPFTVFVCRDFVRSGIPVYLSPDEVRELAAIPGVTIGSHGTSHNPLTACDDQGLAQELVGSRKYLEDLIQKPVTAMSYPHGKVDRRVRQAVANAGFAIGATSRFGAVAPGDDALLLKRTDIWSTDTIADFSAKHRGDWDWLEWRHQADSTR